MKNLIRIVSVFSLSLISIPALSVSEDRPADAELNVTPPISLTEYKSPGTDPAKTENKSTYAVLDIQTGLINEVSVRDYVIGAVCAEMPATFNTEALKAQAVASHTYAMYQINSGKNDESLMGADFSNDPSEYQAFFTDEEIRKYYGDRYDEYYSKVADAVDSVINEILEYNDEPIVAAFHSMSSGTTESAENIWGRKIDYLTPQTSPEDTEAPGFSEDYTFTADEIRSRITARYEDAVFPSEYSEWFSIESTSASGTVLKMLAGNKEISGTEFREIMSVRSAVFTIEYTGKDKFHINTKGFGHGVGMSQYGANSLAGEGKTYSEILSHYYPGTILTKMQ